MKILAAIALALLSTVARAEFLQYNASSPQPYALTIDPSTATSGALGDTGITDLALYKSLTCTFKNVAPSTTKTVYTWCYDGLDPSTAVSIFSGYPTVSVASGADAKLSIDPTQVSTAVEGIAGSKQVQSSLCRFVRVWVPAVSGVLKGVCTAHSN